MYGSNSSEDCGNWAARFSAVCSLTSCACPAVSIFQSAVYVYPHLLPTTILSLGMSLDLSHDERNSSEAPYDLAQSKYLTPIAHAASRVSCACSRISSMLLPLISASWPMLMYPGRPRAARPRPSGGVLTPTSSMLFCAT